MTATKATPGQLLGVAGPHVVTGESAAMVGKFARETSPTTGPLAKILYQ